MVVNNPIAVVVVFFSHPISPWPLEGIPFQNDDFGRWTALNPKFINWRCAMIIVWYHTSTGSSNICNILIWYGMENYIHQEFQDLKWRVSWTLFTAILETGFPYISRIHTAYRWGFLHFRYLNFLVIYSYLLGSEAILQKKDYSAKHRVAFEARRMPDMFGGQNHRTQKDCWFDWILASHQLRLVLYPILQWVLL